MNNKNTKKLVYQILKEEIKEHGIKIDIYVLNKIETIFKIIHTVSKLESKTLNNIIESIKDEIYYNQKSLAGYNYSQKEISVFLDNIKKVKLINEEEYLWTLIRSTYHEYKHVIINEHLNIQIKTIEDFYYIIGLLITPTEDFCLEKHDDMYDEILANLYGVQKAEKYLKENPKYTKTYKKLKNIIEVEKLLHEIHYQNHDIHTFINKLNCDVKEVFDKIDFSNLAPECTIISILYNDDGSFKDLFTLFQDEKWHNLPKEAKLLIISSDAYLEEYDYKNAYKEDLKFILEALSYSYNLENRKKLINRNLRNRLEILSKKIERSNKYHLNIYLETLLILNEKESLNKHKLDKIKLYKEKILNIIDKQQSTPKSKKRDVLN